MAPLDIPQQYVLPVSRTDWAELLVDWQPLLSPGYSLWLLTKFGEVFVIQPDGKVGMLQVSGFQYQVVAKDKTDFLEWLADPDKMAEWFLAPLVDRLEAAGRHLQPEQCYSFTIPLGLGGALTSENVMTIPIREHFRCWGEVFRQTKDVPDGGHVILKPT
ncbi:MAG: DUF1851 domain-containing protein [Verrucomicrobiota bacterium]